MLIDIIDSKCVACILMAALPAHVVDATLFHDLLCGQVLDGLRDTLRRHVEEGVVALRSQVIRAYRLAEHAPAVALSALAAHELHAAEAHHAATCTRFRFVAGGGDGGWF